MLKTKIVTKNGAKLPIYKTAGSAGMDLRAVFEEGVKGVMLQPNQRVLVKTGLSIQLPEGKEAQIRPRSGLAFKHGITVLNAPGTIDSDYIGEIGVLLINTGQESFFIEPQMRIAQMVIASYEKIEWEECERLEETERGTGGFGSTGIK